MRSILRACLRVGSPHEKVFSLCIPLKQPLERVHSKENNPTLPARTTSNLWTNIRPLRGTGHLVTTQWHLGEYAQCQHHPSPQSIVHHIDQSSCNTMQVCVPNSGWFKGKPKGKPQFSGSPNKRQTCVTVVALCSRASNRLTSELAQSCCGVHPLRCLSA